MSRPPKLSTESPLFLLATLVSARRSGDHVLERVTRRRLRELGISITFGNDGDREAKEEVAGA